MKRTLLALAAAIALSTAPASAASYPSVEQCSSATTVCSAFPTSFEAFALTGNAFVVGSGQQVLAAAGSVRQTFANTGTKSCYVSYFNLYSTIAGFATLYVNPTTGLPAPTQTANNIQIASPNVPGCVFKVDTNTSTPLSGGIQSSVAIAVPAAAFTQYGTVASTPLFIVPPGVTLGLNFAFSAATTLSANIYWYER